MIAVIVDGDDNNCEHRNRHYQPKEYDTNIPESYNCEDCGAELEIPEPDWDLMYKEQRWENLKT